MQVIELSPRNLAQLSDPEWLLIFATQDVALPPLMTSVAAELGDTPVFGASSFQGVFTPSGFVRGAYALVGDSGQRVVPRLVPTAGLEVEAEVDKAARSVAEEGGALPDLLLVFATPGFEERVLEGIERAYQGRVPVYGGSAADDAVAGDWQVFLGDQVCTEGVLMIGLYTSAPLYGEFLGGYLPTRYRGVVTKAEGRTIYTIDNEPAATIYNRWTLGLLDEVMESGGTVLHLTSQRPIARVRDRVLSIPLYVLSHPHALDGETGALSFFTEMAEGDEIILMRGSEGGLVNRTDEVVYRALGRDRDKIKIEGALLVYCAGCVGAIMHRMNDVVTHFKHAVGDAPFIGIASFGEQGRAKGSLGNHHGNLMCDVVLFGEG